MKNKIVDDTINGILLAIVTTNVFVVFLPQWIAIALGFLILCKLLCEYLPAITRKLYEKIHFQRILKDNSFVSSRIFSLPVTVPFQIPPVLL